MLPQIASELTQARAKFRPSFPCRETRTILENSTRKLVCYIKCADLYYPSARTQQIYFFFAISLVLEGGVGEKKTQHSFKHTEPASGLLSFGGDL